MQLFYGIVKRQTSAHVHHRSNQHRPNYDLYVSNNVTLLEYFWWWLVEFRCGNCRCGGLTVIIIIHSGGTLRGHWDQQMSHSVDVDLVSGTPDQDLVFLCVCMFPGLSQSLLLDTYEMLEKCLLECSSLGSWWSRRGCWVGQDSWEYSSPC